MTCDRFKRLLDALEGAELSGDMAEHADGCPECARAAAALKAALSLYRLPELASSVDLTPRVLALIPFIAAPRRIVSLRDWIVSGFVILGGMVLLPLMATFGALRDAYGTRFTLPLAIVLGLVITTYAGVFVSSHQDELARLMKSRPGHA